MRLIFLQVFLLLVGDHVGGSDGDSWAADKDVLWPQYTSELQDAVSREDYYSAKQVLIRLEELDPERFVRLQFNGTRAWIAMMEENWATAAHEYGETFKTVVRPRLALERALCLQKLGRYEEALRDLDSVKRRIKDRKLSWEWNFLRGECARLAGRTNEAISAYKTLRYRPVPSRYRIQAQRQLAELYYGRGSKKSGRAAAKTVQSQWSTSDAALETIDLQERYESRKYLDQPDVLTRFAWVCYRNREYDRSDAYYTRILKRGPRGKSYDRALYFKTITHIKKEDPLKALNALEKAYPELVGSKYEGPAAFQFSRVLFMLGRDQEVIDFVDRYWDEGQDAKWRQECVKLKILSMRRMDRGDAFALLGGELEKIGAKYWLLRFFYRNGVAWALEKDDPNQASRFLDKYRAFSLDKSSALELLLWEGLVLWQQNLHDEAIDTWLKLLLRDPNHYFGLVVQHMIRGLPSAERMGEQILVQEEASLSARLLDDLKKMYYLLGDKHKKERVARELHKKLPKVESPHDIPLDPDSDAARWASIARFDLAGDVLYRKETNLSKRSYHFLKAKWYRIGQRPNSSIYHAEVLAKTFPSWAPVELLDSNLQRLLFPIVYPRVVQAKAESHQVDAFLLLALIREESRFDVRAKSVASARGLMQFIPSTAKKVATRINGQDDFELGTLYEPETSITFGAVYLDTLLDSFGGVSLFSIAAYNAGKDAVQRWRSLSQTFDPLRFVWDITYQETRRYCQKVLRSYYQYRRIYGQDETQSVILIPPI